MIVDEPPDAFFQRLAAKIKQQPDGLPGQAQIGQQLLAVNCVQTLDGLDFDEQSLVHQQIDAERRRELQALELDIDGALAGDRIAHMRQSRGEHHFINRLKQSRPKVDAIARPHRPRHR